MPDERAVILPAGVSAPSEKTDAKALVVNDTKLPNAQVEHAVESYFEEHSSMLGITEGRSSFQMYSNNTGSLLARSRFSVPSNVFEEITLARSLSERDDDVRAVMGAILALAYGDGMHNAHEDEVTQALFDKIAAPKVSALRRALKEMHREYLIASQFTTVTPFVRQDLQFQPAGADRQRTRGVATPRIGVLPSEQIRVLGNDLFGTAQLAYKPATGKQERWLMEYFSPATTPARKAEMQHQDPVLVAMLVEQVDEKDNEPYWSPDNMDPPVSGTLYRLNPRMVRRTSQPKGAWKYPRPLMTANFALLEAKRLLNIMDYALLQGGSNFLVVAKVGSDQLPAKQPEVDNLHEVVARASRSGVMIGDHRLDIQIITPDLKELLNPDKRRMLAERLVLTMLRVPTLPGEANVEGVRADVEILTRVVSADRADVKEHTEAEVYEETVDRNPNHFPQGPPTIWFPKIILQGTQFFADMVLKLRDRGDIPRQWAVEYAGFDYKAGVQTRKREKRDGDDKVLTPPPVPFSSPGQGPQDQGAGRPRGTSPDNGAPGAQRATPPAEARPRQVLGRNAGETVTAKFEEEVGYYRIGEQTFAVLEQFDDTRQIGRLTKAEFTALALIEEDPTREPVREGAFTVIPVNPSEDLEEYRAVRLAEGVSMLIGTRPEDDAIMARAFSFREPEYDPVDAQETALRWGFDTPPARRELPAPEPEPADS